MLPEEILRRDLQVRSAHLRHENLRRRWSSSGRSGGGARRGGSQQSDPLNHQEGRVGYVLMWQRSQSSPVRVAQDAHLLKSDFPQTAFPE